MKYFIVFKKKVFSILFCKFLFVYGILIGKFEFPPYGIIQTCFHKFISCTTQHNLEYKNNVFDITEIVSRDCIDSLWLKKQSINLRIIIVGDGHFGESFCFWEKDTATHWKERHELMIKWLNYEVKSKGVDFIVFNGDNVHDDNSLLAQVKKYYDRLETNYYVVHGNHDFSTEEQWQNLWGYSWNHVFEKNNYAFILLNSSFTPNSYDCGNNSWLRKVLRKHKDKEGVFIFCHIPQHPRSIQNNFVQELQCPELTATLLTCKNLKMIVYSHDHDNDRHYKFSYDTNEFNFFFTGHFGHWGLPYYGYKVIEVYDNGRIITYQYNPLTSKIVNCTFL